MTLTPSDLDPGDCPACEGSGVSHSSRDNNNCAACGGSGLARSAHRKPNPYALCGEDEQ